MYNNIITLMTSGFLFIYFTITSLLAQKLVNWLFYFNYLFCFVLKLFWFEICL